MKKDDTEQQFEFGFEHAPGATRGDNLMLVSRNGAALSPAQVEFNKLMKRLENARAWSVGRLSGMV